MENRTDLALESYENQRKTVLPGVKVREQDGISVVEVLDARGEKAWANRWQVYHLPGVAHAQETQLFDGRLERIADLLRELLPDHPTGVIGCRGGQHRLSLRMRWGRRPTAMCWPPVTLPENCAGRWDR